MARITLDRVTKRFADGSVAVRSASFEIADGEFFVLLGPSGCGKSTLLNMIVGLEATTEGAVRLDGASLEGVDPKDRGMAMVFQSYALYPHLTVRQNLAFPLTIARRAPAEIDARVRDIAGRLELTDWLHRKPAQLSGGQRQRVAMGRALVREPRVLLLDEPLSNLDARLRHDMRAELARLQRELGITTIYVTHDQTEAMVLADRIAVMRDGGLQQIGTPREIYEAPANVFVAAFVGTPAMNLLDGVVEDARIRCPIGALAGPREASTSGRMTVGVRPEHLQVIAPGRNTPAGRASPAMLTVERVEWTGADAYARLRASDGTARTAILARVDPAAMPSAGDAVQVSVEPGRIHLFDPATGLRR